jgi:DNA-binding MarR family transcriptional regulator
LHDGAKSDSWNGAPEGAAGRGDRDMVGDPFHYTPGQSLGYLVRDTYRSFTRELEARISEAGVSIGQWYFLRALWEEDGLTQRELSRRVRMMEPTTVTAVNAMERRGLVRRDRDSKDKRKIRVLLTPKGRDLQSRLLPCAKSVNEMAAAGLSENEVATLRHLLERVRRNLGAGSVGGEAAQ